jgi:hypothetical protein
MRRGTPVLHQRETCNTVLEFEQGIFVSFSLHIDLCTNVLVRMLARGERTKAYGRPRGMRQGTMMGRMGIIGDSRQGNCKPLPPTEVEVLTRCSWPLPRIFLSGRSR